MQSMQFHFYYRKKDIPSHLHYQNNNRIAPILIMLDPGAAIYEKRSDPQTQSGLHGYDNRLDEMQTIFVGYGPSFAKGITLENLETVDIYPLLAHLTGMRPQPNNGTLEKFKFVLRGKHDLREKQVDFGCH